MTPKLLGLIEGAADGALRISQSSGIVTHESFVDGPLLAVRATLEDRKRVADVVKGLSGTDRHAALAALFPNLPSKALALLLSLADAVTEALTDDGQLDQAELMQIGFKLFQEAM